MESKRLFFLFVVTTILAQLYRVTCSHKFVGFNRGDFLDGNVCTEGNVIQDISLINTIQCLTACSSESGCNGVFLKPDSMRCVTCSAMHFTKTNSSLSKFYKRKGLGVSAYLLVTELLPWYTAKKNCENLGGHLVIITSKEENEFIVQYVKNASVNASSIHIGAKGTGGRPKTFKWVDGSALSEGYTNWNGGQPYPRISDERYAIMIKNANYRWYDELGGGHFSICEFE